MTLGEYIRDRVREAFTGAISDNQTTFNTAAQAGGDETGRQMQSVFGGGFSIGDILGLIPGLGGLAGTIASPLTTLLGKATEWVAAIASGWTLGELFSELLRPVWLELTHAVANELQTEIFDPATAAGLEAKHIIDNAYGRSEAAGGNLSGEHYDKLVQAARTFPGLPELLDLDNRGVISDGGVVAALELQGYPDDWINYLLALKQQLLGAPDLALATLRGIMSQSDAEAYAARVGVDPGDLAVLIGNTGEPPGLMELLEAYRRGFIDQPTLERGIRQSRVRDEWIPTVERLRYSPMSTSDAVRAVVENYITSDQGATIADQNGLRSEDWPVLVEAWGRPLSRTEMAQLVRRGVASRDQFDQAMRESDIKDKYIDQAFESTTRLVDQRQIVSAVRYGAIDLQTASRMLLELGYTTDGAAVLLKLGLREGAHAVHELSRSQITTLYADNILSRADALSHLTGLGYTSQDAAYMLQIIDVGSKAKAVKAEESAIKIAYLAGNIDKVQAETQLKQAGLSQAQAVVLIGQWDSSKKHAERVLTPAQIAKADKNQVLSDADAEKLLVAAGYSQADATILLQTYGSLAYTPAQ